MEAQDILRIYKDEHGNYNLIINLNAMNVKNANDSDLVLTNDGNDNANFQAIGKEACSTSDSMCVDLKEYAFFPDNFKNLACKLFVVNNLTLTAIADALNVSRSAVRKTLKEAGIWDVKCAIGHTRNYITADPLSDAMLNQLYVVEKLTEEEIVSKYNQNYNSVHLRCQEL